ncbi:hypothetical protein CYLTODRAFT_445259 [Cylindrobasidium torrendii FP15055 ss-10]|uniref:BTB domain-containing protein n=1 Tax=Cylindrobasidium torrendii FP15055 ss-10 TaxID=1314674 RepID=A0A0D7B7R4_9AGAR|nr:hypothetical protein CYLTODRAFT_445259 [Cylindrobasidium torrendii FP15055 ss-10]
MTPPSIQYYLSIHTRGRTYLLSPLIIMNRIGDEVVTQQPLTYTSKFSILQSKFDGDKSTVTVGYRSVRCGLGWSFILRRVTTSAPASDLSTRAVYHRSSSAVKQTTTCMNILLDIESWVVSLAGSLRIAAVSGELNIPGLGQCKFRKTGDELSSSSPIILGSFDYPSSATRPTSIVFDRDVEPEQPKLVVLSTSVQVGQSLRPQPEKFHSRVVPALAKSITTGQLADTKVYLYTRHSGEKSACMPLPSYLNSAIVFEFGCSDLNDLLTAEGFKDTAKVAIDIHKLEEEDQSVDTYDYNSDSDLEEEGEYGLSASHPVEDDTEAQVVLGDSDIADSKQNDVPRQLDDLLQEVPASTRTKFLRVGRVLVIRNTALRTWNALVRYLYFNDVTFAPLKSSFLKTAEIRKRFDDKDSCSPKSMYRLADRLGINELKQLALANINSQMNAQNITRETFSLFSSWYPPILDAQTQTFLKLCSQKSVRDEVVTNMVASLPSEQQFLTHAVRKLLEKARV